MKKIKIENKKAVLSISYGNYFKFHGGTDKIIQSHRKVLKKKKISYLFISPKVRKISENKGFFHFWEIMIDDVCYGLVDSNELLGIIGTLHQEKDVEIIGLHVHHLLRVFIPDVKIIWDNIKLPITMFIHDYYTICENYFLLRNKEEFCGGEQVNKKKCESCCFYKKVKKRAEGVRSLLYEYQNRIIAVIPSQYAREIWLIAYKEFEDRAFVVPHLELHGSYKGNMNQLKKRNKVKVAFIGLQAEMKGWEIWKDSIRNMDRHKELEFFYLGTGQERIHEVQNIEVSFQTMGEDAMIKTLRKYEIDCVVLWSIWPETYSLTFFECYASNVFVITNENSGNIAAMVRKYGNGTILREGRDLKKILEDEENFKNIINQWRNGCQYGPERLVDNERGALQGLYGIKGRIDYKRLIKFHKRIYVRWILANIARKIKK